MAYTKTEDRRLGRGVRVVSVSAQVPPFASCGPGLHRNKSVKGKGGDVSSHHPSLTREKLDGIKQGFAEIHLLIFIFLCCKEQCSRVLRSAHNAANAMLWSQYVVADAVLRVQTNELIVVIINCYCFDSWGRPEMESQSWAGWRSEGVPLVEEGSEGSTDCPDTWLAIKDSLTSLRCVIRAQAAQDANFEGCRDLRWIGG